MTIAKVLEALKQSRANIQLLDEMPALTDWEHDVRINAIRNHALRIAGEWLLRKQKGEKNAIPRSHSCLFAACWGSLDSVCLMMT